MSNPTVTYEPEVVPGLRIALLSLLNDAIAEGAPHDELVRISRHLDAVGWDAPVEGRVRLEHDDTLRHALGVAQGGA